MKLAIAMATYQRKDGQTPFFLKRAIDSVFIQEHTDWQLFVVGDHYENAAEFCAITASYPPDRLRCLNLEKAMEREKYHYNKELLWNNGGVTAINIVADKALAEGFSYICHLDHDDQWKPNHLKVISEAIEAVRADWLCTKTMHSTGVLPLVDSPSRLVPFLPCPGGVINSATCYNYRSIPLRYRDSGTVPTDYDLWKRMSVYMKENNLAGYLINELTCIYEKGGYERN